MKFYFLVENHLADLLLDHPIGNETPVYCPRRRDQEARR